MITGDFIFTQIGSAANAISSVTEGYKGARVNHVGILIETQLGKFVLEAFPPEIRLTNVKVFINRSKDVSGDPRYLAARLKQEHKGLIPDAIKYGLQQSGVPAGMTRWKLTSEASPQTDKCSTRTWSQTPNRTGFTGCLLFLNFLRPYQTSNRQGERV